MVVVVTFLFLILATLFYLWFSRPKASVGIDTVLVFVDAPDPDNPAAVAAIAKHISGTALSKRRKQSHLHVILTGRRVNLKTAKASAILSKNELVRQPWETSIDTHAQRILEDAAARFETYLTNCHISVFTIYDGGVAPLAPLSDRFHEWDFLFDRKDLCSGNKEDMGTIVSCDEYHTLVDKFNGLSEQERENQILSVLRHFDFTSLSDLRDEIKRSRGEIVIFLGGPATGLTRLFSGEGEELRERVSSVYGMFGALQPGQGTLLTNQFNVACDVEAASEFLINNIFPRAEKYMITTETCKHTNLIVSAEDLSERNVKAYFVDLQKLWESTHNGRPQPMFDVIPVMTYLRKYRRCFRWKKQRAVLKEWMNRDSEEMEQRFCFLDLNESQVLEGGGLYVSDYEVDSLRKDDLLDFLEQAWA